MPLIDAGRVVANQPSDAGKVERPPLLRALPGGVEPSTTSCSRAGADHAKHVSTRQCARIVDEWVTGIGLRPDDYGMPSLRRTKAPIIYNQTGGLSAVQSCSGTRRSRARCATSAWTSKMR